MKPFRFFIHFVALGAILLQAGCGPKESKGHDEDESPSGASFKAGKGIFLTDETRNILGLKIADVSEEKLPQVIRFNLQIYGETHRFMHSDVDHSGCDVHGSGFLPPDKALLIEPKAPVKLLAANNESINGFVVAVQKTLAHGETEIIVGVANTGTKLKDGEFVHATITLPREQPVTVIPSSALLRTIEGAFVYTVNGDAYYRTTVKTGSQSDGKIEITDGLFSGDQVVTEPVQTLWIIELRATKGGGHSH